MLFCVTRDGLESNSKTEEKEVVGFLELFSLARGKLALGAVDTSVNAAAKTRSPRSITAGRQERGGGVQKVSSFNYCFWYRGYFSWPGGLQR